MRYREYDSPDNVPAQFGWQDHQQRDRVQTTLIKPGGGR